jgi:hypothetical protein
VKKLIINIGQEAVVGATFDTNGKSKILERVFEFSVSNYYNNRGILDFSKIANSVKKLMPKEIRNLDVELILPTYVTNVSYQNTADLQSEQAENSDVRIVTKDVYIGESQTRKITQRITYNSKLMAQIINSFYREKINVVKALSNVSCYHNFMAVFNKTAEFSDGETKTHICLVWGANKLYYVFMVGNLPVEIRTSDLKITDMYNDIAAVGGDLPFHQILKIIDTISLSQRAEVGLLLESSGNTIFDGEKSITVPESVVDLVKDRFHTFLTDLIHELRTMYDYAGHKYSSGNVHVCTNSRLIDECLCKTVSETFPIEYLVTDGYVEVYNEKFIIKSITEFTDKYAPLLGCIIENMKKGGDFYDA